MLRFENHILYACVANEFVDKTKARSLKALRPSNNYYVDIEI